MLQGMSPIQYTQQQPAEVAESGNSVSLARSRARPFLPEVIRNIETWTELVATRTITMRNLMKIVNHYVIAPKRIGAVIAAELGCPVHNIITAAD